MSTQQIKLHKQQNKISHVVPFARNFSSVRNSFAITLTLSLHRRGENSLPQPVVRRFFATASQALEPRVKGDSWARVSLNKRSSCSGVNLVLSRVEPGVGVSTGDDDDDNMGEDVEVIGELGSGEEAEVMLASPSTK